MEYWAIQTSLTGVDFGELTQATRAGVSHSDGSRGIHAGGDSPESSPAYSNTIAYFTIGIPGLYALGAAALIAFILVRISNKSFGGVSGDVLGASNEITRLSSFMILVSILS